ncbi:hydroquinone glucosyltransferase-like [Mangifera indica]|uniref:hydroquinone glucosyltransferase-like n=1 Tax=Mangifera indica TaxID=29780 RepID=UPI001CF9A686|nr:hydroquinone glucosyltransferase-like [Mangifera indica]
MEVQQAQHTKQTQANVALVPTPGMGHLIPLVELAKRLALHHDFHVTFIIPTDGSPMKPQRKVLQSLPDSISTIFLPPANFDDMPQDIKIETRISLTLSRSLSSLRETLKVLTESTRLVALVADLFGTDALEVAKEFDILGFLFFPSGAMVLSFVLNLPELDKKVTCEFRDWPEPIQLPGCVPIYGRDLADPVQDKKSEPYKWVLGLAKLYNHLAAGIMVNSFINLELGAFKALMESDQSGFSPPVFPVGPLIQNPSINEAEHDCLKWLDEQPSGSVLFISFGSGGTLSQEQLNELALGLEMSGQRFLWVVRRPHEGAVNAAYFTGQGIEDPSDFLPKGFLERTKEVGLVVSSWAPQVQILSHKSTGGFVSHCGWNSTLESIVHGVPLIAWPLYAEQKMNAVLLTDDLEVAMRVKADENGLVGKEDIAKYARGLIEGEEGKLLTNKMRKLKDAAANVLSQDGSSTKNLAKVAQIWKDQK